MTFPMVELRCDGCLEEAFLYQLYGTETGLCAECFLLAYAPETAQRRRGRRAHTPGPTGAGCLRGLRLSRRRRGHGSRR